jgi:hypothetical protein
VWSFSPVTKQFFISGGFQQNISSINKQFFVYQLPQLYKRIQHRLDSRRLDWTNPNWRKRLHSGGESPELRVKGAVPLATIVSSYHVFKGSRT